MGSTTKGPYDPTSTAPVDTLLGNSTSGCILIHNLSQYELVVSTPDNLMQSFVAAWGWRRFDASDPIPKVQWSIAATPAQTNPPLSAVFVESYELRENAPPEYFGQYTRQTSIGGGSINTVTTQKVFPENDSVRFLDAFWDTVALLLRLRPNNPGLPGGEGAGLNLQYSDSSGNFHDALLIDEGTGLVQIVNRLESVRGELSDSTSLGVPVTDINKARVNITTTGANGIISITVPATGIYRISGYVFMNNGTSGQLVHFVVNFTDPDKGVAANLNLWVINGSTSQAMDGAHNFPNGQYPLVSYILPLEAATSISWTYTDPGGTPNDFVTVIMERIS